MDNVHAQSNVSTILLLVDASIYLVVVAIVRHVRRITYTPKLTVTFCYSVLRGMLKKFTYVAPIVT